MIFDTDDEAAIERLARHLYEQWVSRQHMTPAWDDQFEETQAMWRKDAREALEVAAGHV